MNPERTTCIPLRATDHGTDRSRETRTHDHGLHREGEWTQALSNRTSAPNTEAPTFIDPFNPFLCAFHVEFPRGEIDPRRPAFPIATDSTLGHTHGVDARHQFKLLIAKPEQEIPLAEAALWISAEARPEIDVPHWLNEIDRIAERIGARLDGSEVPLAQVEVLNQGFFEQEGFGGNEADYANANNSFLDVVIDTRKGIPITLSILYIEIAKRLGIPAQGVGFPGHFLVKVEKEGTSILVDPFFGRILGPDDCEDLLRRVAGDEASLTPAMLEPTPNREILQRVLRNLKLLHLRNKKFEDALSCSDRIVDLAGDDLSELRDRGLLYRELECAAPALQDLERYLDFSPQNPDAEILSGIVEELRAAVQHIH